MIITFKQAAKQKWTWRNPWMKVTWSVWNQSSFCSETFIIIINVELFFCFIFVVENDTPFEVFDLKIKKKLIVLIQQCHKIKS